MTTIFYEEPDLLIALDRTVDAIGTISNVIFRESIIPERLPIEAQSMEKFPENPTECINKCKEANKAQQVCYAPNREMMAVTTSGEQRLILYRMRPEHAWIISTRSLPHPSNAITFSADAESLLVTDKNGNCYLYDCVNKIVPAKGPLLKNLSCINAILWTQDKQYIITCDNQHKIQVINYPNTGDVHGYCTGHTEFVSGLKFLGNDKTFVSASGDKTLRIWNYESCKELLKVDLPGAAIRFDVRAINENKYETAILHQLDNCVSVYSLEKAGNGAWVAKELGVHKFKDFTACNVCLGDGHLYVPGVVNQKFTLKVIPMSSDRPLPEHWLSMVENQFKQYSWVPEDVKTWFKKR